MPQRTSPRRQLGTDAEDAKELLKQAAERCVERYGIEKTTMEDVAREAGVSRPSVYRYFQDRDDLLLAVMADRSRALVGRAHRFIRRQQNFADGLVEGLIYIADHGRRDPFTRRLVASDGAEYGQRLLHAHNAAAEFAGEFWAPLFDDAEAEGVLNPSLDRDAGYLWLALTGLTLMSLLDGKPESTERARKLVRGFVVPAFLAPAGAVRAPTRRRQAAKQR
jgi:AcrR family transcriptional regulator